MPDKLKLLLLVPHQAKGEVEPVTARLARGLSCEKYELHLGLASQKVPKPEAAPPGVAVHPLGSPVLHTGALRLVRLVRSLKPDLILSTAAQLNFLVLLLRPFYPRKTRVLVGQHRTISTLLAFGGVPWYTSLLYRILYPRADRVICQSHAMADDLCRELGLGKERIAVLPNPVDRDAACPAQALSGPRPAPPPGRLPRQWTGTGPHLLAIGRLAPEKGFDLLLEAFAVVRSQFPQADLIVSGAGSQESALKAQCNSLGLEAAVRFLDRAERPYALFAQSSLFVLPSRREGIPAGLLEALAGNLPIVATPASRGVVDLLRGRPGTWLASEASSSALAAALMRALRELSPGQRFRRSLRSVS